MKYLYTLIGLIFYIITNCEAKVYYDWELLSPKPEIMGINSMKFYDKNTGWAIGSEGLILKTTDGGENWIDKSLKNDSDIMSIIINDENTAFIVAGYSLYKTTDGGNSWVNISKVSFSNILHLKDNIGYAIDKQFPYITSDGGLTWKVFYFEHFKFNKIDDNQEIFIDDFSVLLSKDKWKSFVRMKYNNNMYYSVFNDLSFIYYIDTYNFIQFWDYHVPYYSGQHQTINISLNIKDSNTPYQTCFSNLKLNKICFLDSNICYFITDNGAIIKTSDGGRIWRVQSKWINSSIDVFQFNSEKVGFIVSNGMIYKTNDGGETWQLKPSSTYATSEKQNCITGSDSNTLWIGAGNHSQVIYKSTNKGYTWGAKHFKRNKTNIISLSKVDDSTAWALGYYGVVLKSTDKGDSWNIMLDFNKELKYICFSKKDIGWIVRYDGRVYKSTNAGETWNLLSDSIIFNVQVIKFSDELHGFAACGDGWIMRTSDGGISWQRDYMIDYDNFTDICIVDSANGWLITHYGKVFNSTDGGTLWKSWWSQSSVNSIYFINKNIGFMTTIGENLNGYFQGLLLRTSNRGWDWDNIYLDRVPVLIKFLNENEGWIVGWGASSSALLRTTDAGLSWKRIADFQNALISDILIFDKDNIILSDYSENSLSYYKSVSGDTSWKRYTIDNSAPVISIKFYDKQNGCAFCDENIILKTSDGGNYWQTFYLPDTLSTNGLYFLSDSDGYTYSKSYICNTRDGGLSWYQIPLPYISLPPNSKDSSFSISFVHFIDKNTGWFAVNLKDTLFYTEDGGENWSEKYVQDISKWNNCSFYDCLNGWHFENKVLCYTNDGGFTWEKINDNFQLSYYNFNDSKIGWGYKYIYTKIIYYTGNSGRSWDSIIPISDNISINKDLIHFINYDTCYGITSNRIYRYPGQILDKSVFSITIGDTIKYDTFQSNGYISVNLTVNRQFFTNNIFYLELSDSNGSFVNPVLLGSAQSAYDFSFYIKIPDYIKNNANYRIRAYSTGPDSIVSNEAVLYVYSSYIPDVPNLKINSFDSDTVCINTSHKYQADYYQDLKYKWTADGSIIGRDDTSTIEVLWNKIGFNNLKLSVQNSIGSHKTIQKTILSVSIAELHLGGYYINGVSNVIPGKEYNYNTEYYPYVKYLWSVDNGEIIGSSNTNSVTIRWGKPQKGTIHLSVEILPCDTIGILSWDIDIDEDTTSVINDEDNKLFMISPNPASDFIYITVGARHTVSLQPGNERRVNPTVDESAGIRIYDIYGELVMTVGQTSPSDQNHLTYEQDNPTLALPLQKGGIRIDVSALAPGVYFVQAGGMTAKFVIIR